ncbi:MAG: OmpH family outer membrane protein [Flavobacterium sp.]|nr:OmpH family outer membrane protein [Flavobacterium sp.]MBP6073692.1 OmpH family outer membrane protein [Flavobacterium sp.]
MKKIVVFLFFISIIASAQTAKGVKIAYIDMEYILEKVPDYAEALNQLELKAQKWKQEIETKRTELTTLKENLKTERILLTKELIEEREEEIAYFEKELLDYQEKKFGPRGDLIVQKSVLVKPIQDQIFTIVQDVAVQRKYDFVFDRASDLTMLFADKKYDISDLVVKKLTTAQKREEMSKKQLKALEAKEALEAAKEEQDENPAIAERQRILDEKKAAREKLLEERQKAIEDKKAQAAEKRKKLLEERDAKKNGTVIEKEVPAGEAATEKVIAVDSDKIIPTEKKLTPEEIKQKAVDQRNKKIEERKKALDEKKKKMAEERAAAMKAKEQKTEKKE